MFAITNVFQFQANINELWRSVYLSSSSRQIPARGEVIAALKNQIDFYMARGIPKEDLEDEILLLEVITTTPRRVAAFRLY